MSFPFIMNCLCVLQLMLVCATFCTCECCNMHMQRPCSTCLAPGPPCSNREVAAVLLSHVQKVCALTAQAQPALQRASTLVCALGPHRRPLVVLSNTQNKQTKLQTDTSKKLYAGACQSLEPNPTAFCMLAHHRHMLAQQHPQLILQPLAIPCVTSISEEHPA